MRIKKEYEAADRVRLIGTNIILEGKWIREDKQQIAIFSSPRTALYNGTVIMGKAIEGELITQMDFIYELYIKNELLYLYIYRFEFDELTVESDYEVDYNTNLSILTLVDLSTFEKKNYSKHWQD